jgi:hypothetical protein
VLRGHDLVRWETPSQFPINNSAVNDVAFGVERELTLETADSACPYHDPHCAEFASMRSSSGPHHELLEAVLQASIARVTAADPFGARLIDRSRQRLLVPRVLRIDWAGTQ